MTDDPPVEGVLQVEQAAGLVLGQGGHWDSRPAGEHLGDGVSVHRQRGVGAFFLPALLRLLQLVAEAHFGVPQQGGLLEILSPDGLLQGGDGRLPPLFQMGAVLRLLGSADLHAGRCLVHQVDGFVRQVPVGQVALGQGDGGVDGLVGDDQPVIGLVPGAQGGQDGLGHGRSGRFQLHRLEPAF